MKRNALIITILIFLAVGWYFIYQRSLLSSNSQSQSVDPIAQQIFDQLPIWLPAAAWGQPQTVTQETPYGTLSGQSRSGTLNTDTAMVNHFDDISYLQQLGFTTDNSLLADGPASSSWGYLRHINGDIQIVIVSYKTNPTNASKDEPVQFNCPCVSEASVFVSNPFIATEN